MFQLTIPVLEEHQSEYKEILIFCSQKAGEHKMRADRYQIRLQNYFFSTVKI